MKDQVTCCTKGYKQTPYNVALFMAALLDVQPTDVVYDPSTGGGMLMYAVMQVYDRYAELRAVELVPTHWEESEVLGITEKEFVNYFTGDCTRIFEELQADKIIMNSPFENAIAFNHIIHCFKHNLKPGGILVSFVDYVAIQQYEKQATRDIYEQVIEQGSHWNLIPCGPANSGNPMDCDKAGAVLVVYK